MRNEAMRLDARISGPKMDKEWLCRCRKTRRRCEISALSCQSASASASSNGSMSTSTSPASSSMFKLSLSILWILFPKELGSSRLNPEVRREVSKSERTTFFTDLSFLSISVLFLSSSMMGFSGLISIVLLLDMQPAVLESLSAWAFMILSMLAVHPYSPVIKQQGESTTRSDTTTFSALFGCWDQLISLKFLQLTNSIHHVGSISITRPPEAWGLMRENTRRVVGEWIFDVVKKGNGDKEKK